MDMNTTSQCQAQAGSLPTLPFPMTCGMSIANSRNGPLGQDVLKSCCQGNDVAEFGAFKGDTNCWVYCNATSRSQEYDIWSCINMTPNITGFGCEGKFSKGAASTVGVSGWGATLTLGLVASIICQF